MQFSVIYDANCPRSQTIRDLAPPSLNVRVKGDDGKMYRLWQQTEGTSTASGVRFSTPSNSANLSINAACKRKPAKQWAVSALPASASVGHRLSASEVATGNCAMPMSPPCPISSWLRGNAGEWNARSRMKNGNASRLVSCGPSVTTTPSRNTLSRKKCVCE